MGVTLVWICWNRKPYMIQQIRYPSKVAVHMYQWPASTWARWMFVRMLMICRPSDSTTVLYYTVLYCSHNIRICIWIVWTVYNSGTDTGVSFPLIVLQFSTAIELHRPPGALHPSITYTDTPGVALRHLTKPLVMQVHLPAWVFDPMRVQANVTTNRTAQPYTNAHTHLYRRTLSQVSKHIFTSYTLIWL